jgi:serine/threonine protein kinase
MCDAALNREARERAAFVAAACGGDEALRQEVEALLAHAQTAEGFLAAPMGAVAADVLADEPRASLVGRQVGAYQIVSHLGTGGMGEVYRARDTKLGRDVAFKVLPASFASDPDRLARFEREARLLAALNHPHIGAIYGVEDAANIRGLVLELVEGPTLADRLQQGPVPLSEALRMAQQIADALDAAHEKGIIHRDLKPANVKIAPEGTVKVLDFGLAKAAAADGSTPDLSQSPTVTVGGTRDGIILGSAAYMSPEQARGKPVDKRTDIWAFGCVVYEMLTGRPAFAGETVTDTLAAIVEREPDWRALPSPTPVGVRRLLRRCLEKDRQERLHDIADARLEIKEALTAPDTTANSRAVPLWRRTLPGAVALVLLVGLGLLSFIHFRETPPPLTPPEMRLEIVTPTSADPISFALSPDGRQLVFVASGDGPSRLWLRPLAATAAQPLAGTEGAAYPFWSPDSQSIGFFGDGKLKRVDIGGGPPQTLADASARGGTWNADGVILFAQTINGPLFRIPASGGEAVAVTRQGQHRFPQFLPDGRQFLFYALGTPDTSGIYLGSLDSGQTKRLTVADTAGVYAPSGWLVWVRGSTLVAQHLDLERRALAGDPVTVAAPVGFEDTINAGAFSVSAAGLMAYRPAGPSRRQLRWFDRTGKALPTESIAKGARRRRAGGLQCQASADHFGHSHGRGDAASGSEYPERPQHAARVCRRADVPGRSREGRRVHEDHDVGLHPELQESGRKGLLGLCHQLRSTRRADRHCSTGEQVRRARSTWPIEPSRPQRRSCGANQRTPRCHRHGDQQRDPSIRHRSQLWRAASAYHELISFGRPDVVGPLLSTNGASPLAPFPLQGFELKGGAI